MKCYQILVSSFDNALWLQFEPHFNVLYEENVLFLTVVTVMLWEQRMAFWKQPVALIWKCPDGSLN